MSKEKVYITGVGALTHLGETAEETYRKALGNADQFSEISAVSGQNLKRKIIAGVINERQKNKLKNKFPKVSLNLALAVEAAREALLDAYPDGKYPSAMGLIIANNDANTDVIESHLGLSSLEYIHGASAADMLLLLKNSLNISGMSIVVHNTCASFNSALELGLTLINDGIHNSVLVGGTDMLSSKVVFGFDTLRAIGNVVCRPFCTDRGTITISEGAAFVVLERLNLARKSYCELLGVGRNNDAQHPTSPTYETVRMCHELAAANSKVSLADVNLIFAHGTGTKANDSTEAKIFQELYPQSQIIASKSYLGHTMATCGAVNAVLIAKSYSHALAPGNLAKKSELEFELNWPEMPVPISPSSIIQSNSFGFGGNNSIAIFRGAQ